MRHAIFRVKVAFCRCHASLLRALRSAFTSRSCRASIAAARVFAMANARGWRRRAARSVRKSGRSVPSSAYCCASDSLMKPTLRQAGLRRVGQRLGDEAVGDALVGLEVDLGLRPASCPRRRSAAAPRPARPARRSSSSRPGGVDRELDLLGPEIVGLRARLRQLELDRLRQQRRGDDEDDEQHQHHVDQRDHVDLRHRRAGVLRSRSWRRPSLRSSGRAPGGRRSAARSAPPRRRRRCPAAGPSRRRCAARRRRRRAWRRARGWRASASCSRRPRGSRPPGRGRS